MANSSPSSSNYKGSSSSSSTSKGKGKGKEKLDKKESSRNDKVKKIISSDPFAASLSNRTGLDRFVHESVFEAAWNPVGATSSKK
ncbi:50e534cb-8cf7-4036-8d21-cc2292106660 [Thermothielavioides terrestris]|uniref:50e534cb-8cf7-4036-8d21-cc2292106660 n=1 Tax=Thermothielavioides terrestris TaxID=2587410 RepID=A0A3S4CZS4_9PEZI|nr:50e534cb-8cf7-4036-8d21-cc2292106660 [Thermothielavioides terrestris]